MAPPSHSHIAKMPASSIHKESTSSFYALAMLTQSLTRLSIVLTVCLLVHSHQSLAVDVSAEFSGFGRFALGYLDESDSSYNGYGDNLSAKPDSLFGLQGSAKVGEQFRLTALGLVSHEDKWEAELEWLYLGYRPTSNLDIKIGRMHTPFFTISDSLEVGYAYHWILPPQEVYRDAMVRYFDGGSVQYGFNIDDVNINAQVYGGSFQDDVYISNTNVDLTLESLQGYILKLNWQGFGIRGSFHTADVQMKLAEVNDFEDNLRLAGFIRSANSIDTDGNSDFYQFGIDYHGLNFFTWAEWTRIVPSQRIFAPSTGHYLGFGRYFDELTLAITYANLKDEKPKAVEGEIPSGVNAQLDFLQAGYQSLFDTWPRSEVTSWMLSSRWEYSANIALKAEYKRIHESSPYTTSFESKTEKSDHHSNLYLLSVEWIF